MSGVATVVLVHGTLVAVAGGRARRAARSGRARARLRSAAPERELEPEPEQRMLWRRRLRIGRVGRDGEALADLVDAFAAAIATGMPVSDALQAATRGAPPGLAAPLEEVSNAARCGLPIGEALERWAAGVASPDGADLVAAAFGIATATGGDPAAGLAGVGTTLRERRAVAREVRALSSQARASAAVIALAPVGFALLTAGLGGTAARFLLGSPAGLACLLLGLGLDAGGWRWMRHITESVR